MFHGSRIGYLLFLLLLSLLIFSAIYHALSTSVTFENIKESGKSEIGCLKPDPDLLLQVYVFSAPRNLENRLEIRRTYGHPKFRAHYNISVVFFVGKSEFDEHIEMENSIFKDIALLPMRDMYRDLPAKAISAMKWLTENCQSGKFLMKVDDDVLVNMFPVLDYLKSQMSETENNLHCDVFKKSPADRNIHSKYYVSEQEFPNSTYIDNCYGTFLLFPRPLVSRLYEASKITPRYVYIEDVQTYGYVRDRAGIGMVSLKRYHVLTNFRIDRFLGNITWFAHVPGPNWLDVRMKTWNLLALSYRTN